jgi:Zn-dependent protease with chaperone function
MAEVEVLPLLVRPALPILVPSAPDLLRVLMQPTFYYSFFGLVALSLGFLIVGRSMRSGVKSVMYVLPLIVPLATYAIFRPSITKAFLEGMLTLVSDGGTIVMTPKIVEVLDPVGVILTTGLILGGVYFVVVLIFGGRICRRAMGVVEVGPNDYPMVQEAVRKVAAKAGVRAPKVGIVEEIEPNAFMVGGLRGATLVFSVGLIETLNEKEVEAVAAHEVAHLKNRDYFFEVAVNALKAVSFFNPLAHVMASNALKEREVLADEVGSKLIDCPAMLGKALIKVWESTRNISLRGSLLGHVSGLFVVSTLRRRFEVFSSHPPLSLRVRNIVNDPPKDGQKGGRWQERGGALVLVALVCISTCFVLNFVHNDLLPSMIFGLKGFPLLQMHQMLGFAQQPRLAEHQTLEVLLLPNQRAHMTIGGGAEPIVKVIFTGGWRSGFGMSVKTATS